MGGRQRCLQTLMLIAIWISSLIVCSQSQGSVQPSANCGTSEGCFSQCTQSDCEFSVSWSEDGNFGVYTLSTKTTESLPWMAIAFSTDPVMGGDSVSGCLTADDGSVKIYNAENVGRTKPVDFIDSDVTLESSQFVNNIFTCTIRRLKAASNDGKRFDITQDYTLFFAKGQTSGSSIRYHGNNKWISPEKFSVSDKPDLGRDPSQGSVQPSANCGTSEGCFSQCTQSDCEFSVSWSEDGNFGVYTLSTKTTESLPWMAIAFSTDPVMGGDSVSGCLTADDGSVKIYNAENVGQTKPVDFIDSDVTLESSQFVNNIFTCTIRRLKAASNDGKRFDITQDYTLFFAKGQTSGSSIGYHRTNKWISPEKFSVSDKPDLGRDPGRDPTGSVDLPEDCGLTRGCFSRCTGRQCEFIVSWKEIGNEGVFTLTLATSSSNPWVALGLSSDSNMGADSVIGCQADSGGTVSLFSAENKAKVPEEFIDDEVKLGESSFSDGVLSCTFTRPKEASANGKRFDINKEWTLLLAFGSLNAQDKIAYHGANKYISSGQYSVSDKPSEGASALEFPLIKVHGCLMIGAWIFFASIGIVAARYYKPVWAVTMCSQKVWFQMHRTCMVLVFCCTVAGFIVIFVEVEEWSELQEPDGYLDTHPILGVVVTALTILNPLMAFFRPHPGTKNRPIFNWAHWFVGTAAHILGVITIFFGVQLVKADGPDYLVYILASFVGWQVFVEVLLEIIQCCTRKVNPGEAYDLDDIAKPKTPANEESAKTSSIKRVILVCHIFVVGSITAVLIGLLAVGERELED